MASVRKVVIPAAGLGTRFLPATKVLPKEMLPVAARPLIQYAVEEAALSGAESAIIVVAPGKDLVVRHFERNLSLEQVLALRGSSDDVQQIRRVSELVEIRTVQQDQPLGLAKAIAVARPLIGDEPFAVILPDALIHADIPCVRQLIKCYEQLGSSIVATQQVDPSEVSQFGIIDVLPLSHQGQMDKLFRVTGLQERPLPTEARSRYGIFGRYVLEPYIFSCIDETPLGRGGEFQLTDALALYSARKPLYAYRFEGSHYDAGSKLGFVEASLAYALRDPEISNSLRQHLLRLGASFSSTIQ
ncbi:MAG: UTP--glucose-1-phosphate uridylyltransferase [Acidobacteria bacterium]|nr:UTP--glucose-1-phosphate uridylyltransferase [Acidobacteriota bacterium]